MNDASPSLVLAPAVLAAQALAKQQGVGTPNVLTTPITEVRAQSRAYHRWLSEPATPIGRIVEYRLEHLAVPATLRLYYPKDASDAPLPLYLHLHGGGFAQGDLDTLDRWKREIAE